jgi:succinate-semialdehyde dehydrogenase/glutarate-semialdehyde dehydrogenase
MMFFFFSTSTNALKRHNIRTRVTAKISLGFGDEGAPELSRYFAMPTARTSHAGRDKGAERAVLRSVNPYNGQTLHTVPEMTEEEIDSAISKACERFKTWRHVAFSLRATFLRRAAKLCRERGEELARLMSLEMGKRIAEGREEVELCAPIFEYYADRGEHLLAPEILLSPLGDGTLVKEPLGVLFGVEPWNYPCYQIVRFAVPQLMAGNVVLMKHSSSVQLCAEALDKIFRDAGFGFGSVHEPGDHRPHFGQRY